MGRVQAPKSWFVMSVQTVDATPSGIKLFSKVVFMKQGKRFGLSAEQKSDVWPLEGADENFDPERDVTSFPMHSLVKTGNIWRK